MSGSHLSKDFFELVKAIGESKSKQEEDRIILDEVAVLKKRMPEATVTRKKMKEFLVRVIYVEMLGHDASFGYIKAIELTASQNLIQKKVGYLTSALTLSPDHEFRVMIINQLQRDMKSANFLEACAGLGAVCKLVTKDMIPAVLPDVVALLSHERELVRKRAVTALHRLHQLDKNSVAHMGDAVRRTLCDKDPSVMGAALCLLSDMIKEAPAAHKDLVPSFVSILKQITEHRLPREYDYHRMPAPWIQLRILHILGLLGRADRVASEGMYEVLMDVMRRADTGINVGYAVVYECVRTVTAIYPNAALLDAAAASISRFISSDNHNLKYVGVTGLAAIARDHPRYAAEHQLAVIDCLEDPDETLKRKTLNLLFSMTNPVNVEFITEKLLSFLSSASDVFWRQDLVKRITQCAEKFAPSNSWYVGVMTRLFELAGELVKSEVAHGLMQLIAEGSGDEDDEADEELRRDAVESYVALLPQPGLPDLLVQTMAWVLGEYGYLCESRTPEDLVEGLSELAPRPFKDSWTRGYIITAVAKIVAHQAAAEAAEASGNSSVNGAPKLTAGPTMFELLERYSQSMQPDLRQRCLELLALLRHADPAIVAEVLPADASCEDVEADENLAFLDGVVASALAAGAVKYSPPADADEEDGEAADGSASGAGGSGGLALRLTPYAKPERPSAPLNILTPNDPNGNGATGGNSSHGSASPRGPGGIPLEPQLGQLKLKPAAVVWGRAKPGGAAAPGAGYPVGGPVVSATVQAPAGGGSTWGRGAAAPTAPGSTASQPLRQNGGGAAKSPEQVEKERQAAQLFGGVSGGGSMFGSSGGSGMGAPRGGSRISGAGRGAAARSGGAVASPKLAAAAAPAALPQAAPATVASLLQTSPVAQPTPSPAVPVAPSLDLLDMSFGASPPKPAGKALLASTGAPLAAAAAPLDPFDPLSARAPPRAPAAAAAAAPLTNGVAAAAAAGELPATTDLMRSLGLGPPAQQPARAPAAAATGFLSEGRTMAPLRITTAEFGPRWMQCPGECKKVGCATAPALGGSVQAIMDRLASHVSLHSVEIIHKTSEGILAGALAGGAGETVLVHCKVWPGGRADVTVRAMAGTAGKPVTPLEAVVAERVLQVLQAA